MQLVCAQNIPSSLVDQVLRRSSTADKVHAVGILVHRVAFLGVQLLIAKQLIWQQGSTWFVNILPCFSFFVLALLVLVVLKGEGCIFGCIFRGKGPSRNWSVKKKYQGFTGSGHQEYFQSIKISSVSRVSRV
jgi:hypothetical protein